MKKTKKHLEKIDWVIVFSALFLSSFGALSIYSSSFFRDDFFNFKKQVIFIALGVVLMFLVSFCDWRMFKDQSHILLGIWIILVLSLFFLFILGQKTKGVKGWYRFGAISFDPVPFMEIALILVLAKYFSERHVELYNFKHILISGFYAFLPFLFVFFQPDLGSAVSFGVIWLGILVASGIKIKDFLFLMVIFLIISVLAWSFLLRPYQKERVFNFLFPEEDILGGGWSQMQSKIAISTGGLWGKGFKKGEQVQRGFLTLPQTDFIFASIAHEFGLMGVTLLLGLILILCWRIVKVCYESRGNFPRLFALGLAISLFFQAFVHVGMNLGILPIVGLPFPLVSYGGSGIIAKFLGLGILQSLVTHPEK